MNYVKAQIIYGVEMELLFAGGKIIAIKIYWRNILSF